MICVQFRLRTCIVDQPIFAQEYILVRLRRSTSLKRYESGRLLNVTMVGFLRNIKAIMGSNEELDTFFVFLSSSSYTVWCRGKYKVRVRALDIAARMSQFSSDAQMYFISSAQRRLGRPRGFFEFDLVL